MAIRVDGHMGYYRRYYEGRTYVMAKSVLDSRCGCGQESIWMMEDKTCKCDSCVECNCDPSVCKCDCHCKEESDGED